MVEAMILGSPPRVRGRALNFRTVTRDARITPARAGKRGR